MWIKGIHFIGLDLKISGFKLKTALPIRCVEEVLVGVSDMLEILQYFKGFIRLQNKIDGWGKGIYINKWLKEGMDIPYGMLLEAKKSEPFDLVDIQVKDREDDIKVKIRVR